jgi:hypothetical protein
MDKENVVHINHGILFSCEKEKNPVICDNMDWTGEHYANEIIWHGKTCATWSHLILWKQNCWSQIELIVIIRG